MMIERLSSFNNGGVNAGSGGSSDRPSTASTIGSSGAGAGKQLPQSPQAICLYKIYHSKRLRLLLIILILIIGFVGNIHRKDNDTTSFLVVGGCIGAFSSAAVMMDILIHKRDGSMLLLFWRACADLGVAIRFILTFNLNRIACGSNYCYLPTGTYNQIIIKRVADHVVQMTYTTAIITIVASRPHS
jgi:hypothetical protein